MNFTKNNVKDNLDIQKLDNLLKISNKNLKTQNYNNEYQKNDKAIFICLDENCIKGLIMVIQSILNYNNKNKYVFNILCEDLVYDKTVNIVNNLFSDINFNIKKFINEELDCIQKYFNNSCLNNIRCRNVMNFARFFYEKYFDENYYLYTDTDMIFNGNIDIFFENLENEYIKVILNHNLEDAVCPIEYKKKYLSTKYNLDFNSNGFNAGIYSINNFKSKNENHLQKIINLMNEENNSFN